MVVIQDADLEYSPEEYPELLELIIKGHADVVYGSRFLGKHRVFLFTHYLGNRIVTLATNLLVSLSCSGPSELAVPAAVMTRAKFCHTSRRRGCSQTWLLTFGRDR